MDILKLHGFYTTNGKLILLMLDWINQEITLKIMSIYLDVQVNWISWSNSIILQLY